MGLFHLSGAFPKLCSTPNFFPMNEVFLGDTSGDVNKKITNARFFD